MKLNLVRKFQEELEISKGKAVIRVIFSLLFVVATAVLLVLVLTNFPYQHCVSSKEIVLPSGNYRILPGYADGVISLSDQQFAKISEESDTIFLVHNGKENINFIIENKRLLFSKNLHIETGPFYNISTIKEIEKGKLAVEMKRSIFGMIFTGIIFPLFFIFTFFICVLALQSKKDGYGYDDDGKYRQQYKVVWW